MNAGAAIAVDAAVWAAWGTVVGRAAASSHRFTKDGRLTRPRPWELATWERLGARRLSQRLPDAGGLFGVRKRAVVARGREALADLATETRRAETVHWVAMVPLAVMPAWSPAWVTAVMVGYAVVANLPCIIVQRFNRARVARALTRGCHLEVR